MDVKELAKDSGMVPIEGKTGAFEAEWWSVTEADIKRFAEMIADAAVLAERESCARVCDDVRAERDDAMARASADMCSVLIRARGLR